MMFIARLHDEGLLYRLAGQLERERPRQGGVRVDPSQPWPGPVGANSFAFAQGFGE